MAGVLIAITQLPEDIQFLAEIAARSGMSLRKPPDMQVAMRMMSEEENAAIFVDASTRAHYDRFELAVQDSFGLFSARVSSNRIHYLSSEDIFQVPYLIASPLFGSYIRRNYSDVSSVADHYARVVTSGLHHRGFGLANLNSPGVRLQSIRLTNSAQKQEAVDEVKNYLVALKFQTRMASVIANAVDELLMNAMFDAPTDATGRHLYDATARSSVIELSGKSSVELQVTFDGTYVALTAIDLYGSIDKSKLLAAISAIYRDQEYRVRQGVAGAGLGLATVFHSGGSFLFSSEQGVRTEVTVFFRKTDNFREFKNQFRFISTQFHF